MVMSSFTVCTSNNFKGLKIGLKKSTCQVACYSKLKSTNNMLNTFTIEQLWQDNCSCRKLKKQLQTAMHISKVILLMVYTGMILSNMLNTQ